MARKDAIKKLRGILLERRRALFQALAGDKSLLNEMTKNATGDVIDFALDTAKDEIFSKLAEAESRELAHIEYALEKMNEGSYGKCEACNCNIPLARLQALPYATLCVSCKRKVEQGVIAPQANGDWSRVSDTTPIDESRLGDFDPNFS